MNRLFLVNFLIGSAMAALFILFAAGLGMLGKYYPNVFFALAVIFAISLFGFVYAYGRD